MADWGYGMLAFHHACVVFTIHFMWDILANMDLIMLFMPDAAEFPLGASPCSSSPASQRPITRSSSAQTARRISNSITHPHRYIDLGPRRPGVLVWLRKQVHASLALASGLDHAS